MGFRDIGRAADNLDVVLRDVLRLRDGETERIIDSIKDFAEQIANNEIDRVFNRGDYQS